MLSRIYKSPLPNILFFIASLLILFGLNMNAQTPSSADSIAYNTPKELVPKLIENYDKFENKSEIMVVSRPNRNVYCNISKWFKGKSVYYTMYWEVYSPSCHIETKPVSFIILFKDGTKLSYKLEMDTEVGENLITHSSGYLYTVFKTISLSTVQMLSNKEIEAIKLYIFEEDFNDSKKNEQFMVDLKALIKATKPKK